MKLSKSKLDLAKVINENGGWVDGADCATQDKDMWVCFYEGKPSRCGDSWKDSGDCLYKYGFDSGERVQNWHQCVLSREEYYQAYPKADADGWIEWKGGECPVGKNVTGDIKLACGEKFDTTDMAMWNWHLGNGNPRSIIAYRQHKPEVKPEFCESVTRSIPEPAAYERLSQDAVEAAKVALMSESIEESKRQPTIEQLASDYRNARDYANRKQEEADAAKADADAKLKALEIAGEAIGLLVSPITEKQEPELAAVVKVGDEVECVESNIKRDKYSGMVGRLHTVDESDTSTPYLVDFGGNAKIWCHEVKFIRRP